MRYAQILNNKVHWIFEDEMTLEELGQHKYNLSQITLIDITDVANVQEGYVYQDGNFVNPASLINDADQLATIKASKLSDIKARLSATDYKCLKYIDGDLTETEYAPIKTERASLRTAYNAIEAVTTIEEVNSITY